MQTISIYNTLSRKKEEFIPLNPPRVGLYVCGPTVYGDAHLGHVRPAVTFDLLFRLLIYLGYSVRYVRNITDVGHLENDSDAGEDKISKKARLEQIEPMEIVQFYLNQYHDYMRRLNVLPPSIEPMASGHIIEQQQMVKKILDNGFAYESKGSVYFDVDKYNKNHKYGKLSGRKTEDLLTNTRSLEGQDEKRNPMDFAIWKKADERHIMRWPSAWSDGFPGWHLECSVMSSRYLGEEFDIHGGGLDLLFPHHECEIAQSVAANGKEAVRYWMHNNMITINGQKMGRSLGNFITLDQLFTGQHPILEQAYSPMTIRFFMLQAHYRSTLDFSNEALIAAEKGLKRLFEAIKTLEKITPEDKSTVIVGDIIFKAYSAIKDDLNSPIAIGQLFEAVKIINAAFDKKESLDIKDIEELKSFFKTFVFDILGLKDDELMVKDEISDKLINTMLEIRQEAKEKKDFATSDRIRDELIKLGIEIKDRKDGFDWKYSNS
jgi:cysteinyl-tRNA synthetase